MSDTRRKFLTLLAGAGTLAVANAGALVAQTKPQTQGRPVIPDGPPEAEGAAPPLRKSPTKAMLEDNEKDIKKNIETLFQLVTDLKAEVEKTDSSQVLSLTLMKKAEEIEKLAHDIRIRAKA